MAGASHSGGRGGRDAGSGPGYIVKLNTRAALPPRIAIFSSSLRLVVAMM